MVIAKDQLEQIIFIYFLISRYLCWELMMLKGQFEDVTFTYLLT